MVKVFKMILFRRDIVSKVGNSTQNQKESWVQCWGKIMKNKGKNVMTLSLQQD